MATIIKDADVVQFENAVVVAGTWKKAEGEPSFTHRTVITGELTGLQLRGILEGSSSLRVQYQNQVLRKGKPALDKGTWTEFLARLSAKGAKVVSLLGFDGGKLKGLSDEILLVPSDQYGVVEDMHMAIAHVLTFYLKQKKG